MTKLTKQEIEKEREKFEAYLLSFLGSNFNDWWSEKLFRYQNIELNHRWEGWLARAELAKGGE